VRKQYPAIKRQRCSASATPRRTSKIAKTVDRHNSRFVKGRRIEGRGEAGQVVFDVFNGPSIWPARERPQFIDNVRYLLTISPTG
jgi:hypothetical protein